MTPIVGVSHIHVGILVPTDQVVPTEDEEEEEEEEENEEETE